MLLPLFAAVSDAEEVSLQEVYDAGLPVVSITTVDGEEPTFEVAKVSLWRNLSMNMANMATFVALLVLIIMGQHKL